MKIHLAIISGILVIGGILFYPQYQNYLPNDNNFDDTKDDLIDLTDDTINKVDETIDNTYNTVTSSIDDALEKTTSTLNDINPLEIITAQGLIQKEPVHFGQVFEKNKQNNSCKISIPDMAQTIDGKKELTHVITIENCEFNVNDSVQIRSQGYGGSSSGSSSSSPFNFLANSEPTQPAQPIVELTPSNLIFNTLSLSTTRYQTDESIVDVQLDPGDIQIRYEDTSRRTTSVTLTLKNTEKELFSGVFQASKFETFVNDIPDTSHIIEMVIEHEDHGTITSSVFNPAGNFDKTISGVFIKS